MRGVPTVHVVLKRPWCALAHMYFAGWRAREQVAEAL
jgi:hypothetical protein